MVRGFQRGSKDLSIFSSCNEMFSEFDRKFSLTPLITAGKVAALVVDEVQNSWYSIVSPTGDILAESDRFVGLLKEKLPHLRRMSIRTLSGAYRESNKDVFEEFDREEYIKRCLSLYDTANYPGLASVGVHMPIKSLRRIYVPTSANVEQQQSAIEATERAIDELVETLGLDEHQREQLTKQMKARYGSQKTTEVGAASKLYQNFSNLLVLGDPGSGKTCLVRAEMMSYCTSDDEKDRSWYGSHVPIFLPLAEYLYSIDTPLPLLKQCVSHARDQGLSITSTQMDDLLSRGRVAFFFDGLDEVGSIRARQKVIDEITNLVEQYAQAGNRFVLTSRPAAVRDISLPIELSRVSLLGLTDSEIQLLVNRLFKARYEKGTSLTEKDKDVIRDILRDCKETPGIRRLARNPLLLTLLVLVYENSGAFLAKRHLIYSQAIKTLVSVRHRQIRRAVVSESDLRIRLGKLAVAMFRGKTSPLPTRAEAAALLDDPNSESNSDSSGFLTQVAETTGVVQIHPRANHHEDLISFMHYSFLEYYTAVGFLENETGIDLVSRLALNQRWREVVTLMFGIFGEHKDITNHIKRLCETNSAKLVDAITASRLLLSLDCALECNVPPEATQKFLANEIENTIRSGAALAVSEVRSEIGERVKLLLESTDSSHLRYMILNGIKSENEEVSAAFIELAATTGNYVNEDDDILDAISQALQREKAPINISVINAIRELPKLRSGENIQKLTRILDRGGIVEKTAVLQLLEEQTAISNEFEAQLVNLLYGNSMVLSEGAARSIIRGKLFQKNNYTDYAIFDRALRAAVLGDQPRKMLSGSVQISMSKIEEWISSSDSNLRERGFRSLVITQTDTVRAHDIIFGSLKSETESKVLAAILYALASYKGAVQAATLAETDLLCRLAKSKYSNVRRAASRALRVFPSIQIVTKTLIERFQITRRSYTAETREVIRGISEHAVRDKTCRSVIADEVIGLLSGKLPRWTAKNVSLTTDLLIAADQIGIEADSKYSRIILKVVKNFRIPVSIRRLALKLYGQICAMDTDGFNVILAELSSSDSDHRLAAYRAGRRLLQRCRSRLESIQLVQPVLPQVVDALVGCWTREVGLAGYKFEQPALREIRNFLVDIEVAMSSYQEFSERMNAGSLATELKENRQ